MMLSKQAWGGNKARKLSFLVARALTHGSDRLVAYGDSQSNHCLQTAVFAARHGLACSLVFSGHPPCKRLGNLLLDELFGADLIFSGAEPKEAAVKSLICKLRTEGARPYPLPFAGSNGFGAIGYVAAMEEVLRQLRENSLSIDTMVLASGSGGTQAGLVLGAHLFGYQGSVLGISTRSPAYTLAEKVSHMAINAADILGKAVSESALRINVNDQYIGNGCAVIGNLEREAIRLVARTEGLLLDPVYTGLAMGGLLDLIAKGVIPKHHRILFWHTGGTQSLSAFADELSARGNV